MYRYNFVLWNCQWIAKENLSHGTQSKERKLLSTDLVNNRFLNYEQGGVVGDLWRHSKWRTSYILRNLFKDANKESKHFSSALKDENFMIKYIFWYKIFLIKKKQTNKETDRQNKRRGMYQSHSLVHTSACSSVRMEFISSSTTTHEWSQCILAHLVTSRWTLGAFIYVCCLKRMTNESISFATYS